jgi:hypothetical protein
MMRKKEQISCFSVHHMKTIEANIHFLCVCVRADYQSVHRTGSDSFQRVVSMLRTVIRYDKVELCEKSLQRRNINNHKWYSVWRSSVTSAFVHCCNCDANIEIDESILFMSFFKICMSRYTRCCSTS